MTVAGFMAFSTTKFVGFELFELQGCQGRPGQEFVFYMDAAAIKVYSSCQICCDKSYAIY